MVHPEQPGRQHDVPIHPDQPRLLQVVAGKRCRIEGMEPSDLQCKAEIAAAAARLVVEDGLEYGPAKRQAARLLGLAARAPLPANEDVEDAVFEYIAVFCADTQEHELACLRALALRWMERMAEFRPYLTSAVWRGSATRHSYIQIELFCDDCKSAEIKLIDQKIAYDPQTIAGMRGETVEALCLFDHYSGIDEAIAIHLLVYDHDQLRGALRPDNRGRTPRGSLAAVRELVKASATSPDKT